MNLAIEKSIEPTERDPVCSVCCKPHDKDNPVGYFYPPANELDSWEQAAACDDPDAVPLYAAPVRTKDLTDVEDLQDAMTKALKKAFQLGQTYFQQADSESYTDNKRADITLELYRKLEDDTCAVIAADREKNK